MNKLVRNTVIAFLLGVITSLITVTVSAGTATGQAYGFKCNGISYGSTNQITTDSSTAKGYTCVVSLDAFNQIPAGYIGIQSFVYKVNSPLPVTKSSLSYNPKKQIAFGVSTPYYYSYSGAYYTQGLTYAYKPTSVTPSGETYEMFSTYPSPNQNIG